MAALLIMTALSGCTGGTGESSEDKSSNESTVAESSQDAASQGTEALDAGEPVYGGKVVVGVQQDIDSLDPHKATAAGTKEILFNIFEGLVKPDPNGNLMNAVASDYSVSEDGLTYTFTLRDGVKFHNGNAVTAEDVKYSLDRVSGLLDGTALISTLSADKGGITSVDILDEKTVQVTVGSANLELIYSFTAAIIPAGSGEDIDAQPVGTGPFSFVSYTPQEGIVVAKNADYWQEGLPYLDEVEFKIVTGANTALPELKGGSIDIYPYLTDSQANELEGSMQVIAAPSNVVQALFLNNADDTLKDVRVRQAICYALDKDSVNEFVFGGNGAIVSAAMLPTMQSYYVDLNDVYGTGANIEKAKELLIAGQISEFVFHVFEFSFDRFDQIFYLPITEARLIHGDYNTWNIMLNREKNQAIFVIDPFGSCYADNEYDLYQLDNANGQSYGLLKRYAEKFTLSENFDVKRRFYKLYSEIGHYYDARVNVDLAAVTLMAKELLEVL